MILHGVEYQRPTSLNVRILADHVTYSFLAFMKSIFHFCLGCYCGGYSQNWRSNLSSLFMDSSSQGQSGTRTTCPRSCQQSHNDCVVQLLPGCKFRVPDYQPHQAWWGWRHSRNRRESSGWETEIQEKGWGDRYLDMWLFTMIERRRKILCVWSCWTGVLTPQCHLSVSTSSPVRAYTATSGILKYSEHWLPSWLSWSFL